MWVLLLGCRDYWEQAFRKMHENKDDQFIIDDNIDLDQV